MTQLMTDDRFSVAAINFFFTTIFRPALIHNQMGSISQTHFLVVNRSERDARNFSIDDVK